MPTNSRVQFGFAFLTPTGRPVRSQAKKIRALHRFFQSEGRTNDVEGVHVVARFRNPDDLSERSQRWKTTDEPDQSLEAFHDTLNGPLFAVAEGKATADYEALKIANQIQRTKVNRSKGRRSKVPPVATRKAKARKLSGSHLGKKRKTAKSKKRK